MLEQKVLGDIASWCWPYLVAKYPHAWVNMDGIACPCTILWPTVVSRCDRATYLAPFGLVMQ
jgi:hypothetical protein